MKRRTAAKTKHETCDELKAAQTENVELRFRLAELRAEYAKMRLLVTALRDVNADLDRRAT